MTDFYPSGLQESFEVEYVKEAISDALSQGPPYQSFNSCSHTRVTASANGWVYGDATNGGRLVKNYGWVEMGSAIYHSLVAPNLPGFVNFGKLPFQDNNGFDLIPAILDLDGTLAMATAKFWKQLNYGALTWSVIPFYSEVRSLGNSVRDIFQGRIDRDLQAVNRMEKAFPVNVNDFAGNTFEGTLYLDGHVSSSDPYPDINDRIDILLDEIGFNPDLKSAWEVIPLSFVVDYFLPVGAFIDHAHPRGWFKPTLTFNGNATLKGKWKYMVSTETDLYAQGTLYLRGLNISVDTNPHKVSQPKWQCPSAVELFNTVFLGRRNIEYYL